ncbi:hypothetical protein, partial [Pumilibacter intestinalis]|uniref:hypothetical protein n=1 Tax=Pumilibacter intestinalis TaxID=2941511 RepID=UPI002040473A
KKKAVEIDRLGAPSEARTLDTLIKSYRRKTHDFNKQFSKVSRARLLKPPFRAAFFVYLTLWSSSDIRVSYSIAPFKILKICIVWFSAWYLKKAK